MAGPPGPDDDDLSEPTPDPAARAAERVRAAEAAHARLVEGWRRLRERKDAGGG